MSIKQTAVRLPSETYVRLKALADRTGRTTNCHMREAIEEHLLDAEDLATAERALITHRESSETPLSLDELDAELGLDR